MDLGNSRAPRRRALGSPSLSKGPQPSFLPPNQLFFPGLQALAALVPGVSQVVYKFDFLGKKPHRRHPGILQLSLVRPPQALVDAAPLLLLDE